MKFEIDLGTPPARSSRRRAERPLAMLVIGDLSGATPTPAPLAPTRIDIDNFDAVMSAFEPSVEIAPPALGGATLTLRFTSLEDFHPDALYAQWSVFSALREQRALLSNPATFQQAASSLLEARGSPPTGNAELFETLLGSRGRETAPPPPGVVQKLISGVVAPYILPDIAPEQSRYIASVDAAIAALMRDILHSPAFQALEAAWRGVRALVDETEGGEEIEIWLLDASAARLDADLAAHVDDPAKSGLHEVLVGRGERSPDATPWSIVVGDYLFGGGEPDLRRLATLGAFCRRAGAVFLGGADRAAPGEAASWAALRRQPFASAIALAAPRTLLRLPYGKTTDSIDSFAFEELAPAAGDESLLWGNSAFTLGRLLIRGFLSNGWDSEPGDELEIGDLPALVRGQGDERALQACAEVFLNDATAEQWLSRGLVPLQSHQSRPSVRVLRFQSIADPPAAPAFSRTST